MFSSEIANESFSKSIFKNGKCSWKVAGRNEGFNKNASEKQALFHYKSF